MSMPTNIISDLKQNPETDRSHNTPQMEEKKEKLLSLIRDKCLKTSEEGFILASGERSKYYIDLGRIAYSSLGSYLLGYLLYMELLFTTKNVVGRELGAVPLVVSITNYSYVYGFSPVDGIVVRKRSKGYGANSHFEGEFTDEKRVVIIEDVVATGNSIQFVIDKLSGAGISPLQVVSVVDRNSGVNFTCRYDPLFTLNQLIESAQREWI